MSTLEDTEFLRRLGASEDFLLDCIANHSSLPAFIDEWEMLLNDLTNAVESGSLSPSTITVATRLSEKISESITSLAEVDVLCQPITMTESVSAPVKRIEPMPAKVRTRTEISRYIPLAYRWLLQNLHEPYPAPEIRASIAASTNSPRKDVDNWFIDIRKRIGWNALRRKSFSNKRAEIVQAASSFFKDNDGNVGPELELEFASIASRAQDLYGGKWIEDLETHIHQTEAQNVPNGSGIASGNPSPCSSVTTLDSEERGCRKRKASLIDDEYDISQKKKARTDASIVRDYPLPSSAVEISSQQDNEPQQTRLTPSACPQNPERHEIYKGPHLQDQGYSELITMQGLSGDTLSEDTSFEGWFEQAFDTFNYNAHNVSVDLRVSAELDAFNEWSAHAQSDIAFAQLPDYAYHSPIYQLDPAASYSSLLDGWEPSDYSTSLPSYTRPTDNQHPDLASYTNEGSNLPDYSESALLPVIDPPVYHLPDLSITPSQPQAHGHESSRFVQVDSQRKQGLQILEQLLTHSGLQPTNNSTTQPLARHEKERLLQQMKQVTQELEAELATSGFR